MAALLVLLAGMGPAVHAQPRLAFLHGEDAEGTLSGPGAFAWLSNGDGTFTPCRVGTTGFDRNNVGTEVFGASVAEQTFWADVDRDGLADVVHASENDSRSIRTYRALGNGTFATTAIATVGINNTGVGGAVFAGLSGSEQGFLADVTGDQNPDYVFTTSIGLQGIFVWPGNGAGGFSTAAPIATTGLTGVVSTTDFNGESGIEATFLADVTGDGVLDVVHASDGDGRTIAVWRGNGNGTFQTTPTKTTGFVNTGVTLGTFAGVTTIERSFLVDVTGDGRLDYVFTIENGGIFVWPGNGDGTFSTAAPITTTVSGSFASLSGESAVEAVQLVDVTSDGVPDYVVSKDDEGANAGIYVWRGNGNGTFVTTPIVTRASGGIAAFATGSDGTQTTAIAAVVAAGQSLLPNACTTTAPGGVAANLLVWSKANAGIAVGEGQGVPVWQNVADPSWSLAQTVAGSQPTYFATTAANLLNFNPALRFDGLDQLFKSDVRLHHGSAGFHGIAIARDERTNRVELRGFMGMGDGNMPAFDLQTDAVSPNGWNPFMAGGVPAEWDGGSARLFNGNTGGANRQPQLFALGSANGGSDNVASAVDGFEQTTTLDANNQGSIGLGVWVGSSNGEFWLGLISESIVYSRRLSATELRRVQSYLAVKHGLTLRAPGAVAGAGDYVDAAGTTIWAGAANPTFHNDVAAIARDVVSGLDQRVSQSVNAGDQVTIAAGAYDFAGTVTAQAPATAIGDASALAWGHNALGTAITTAVADPAVVAAGVQFRMARVWRTQVTGGGLPAQVSIRIPATLVESATPIIRSPRLLVATTADFTGGARAPIPLTKSGAFYVATFPTFTAGELFTVGDGILPVRLSKTFASSTLAIGTTTRLTFTLSNPDAAAQSGLAFTDTLPAGLVVATPANLANTCGGTATAAGSVVALSGGALAGTPATCSIAVDVTSAAGATAAACPAPATTNAAANVGGLSTNLVLAAGFGACVGLVESADLSVSKTAPATLLAGGTAQYGITVANDGPSPAASVVVTDTLPAQLAFVGGSPGCTAVGQTVTCAVGTIAAGQSVPLTVTVQVAPDLAPGATVSNTVSVTSPTPDPHPADNTPAPVISPPATASADLSTAKSVLAASVTPGATFTYRIVVANAGPSVAAGVTVSDTLPAETTFVSSPSGCTAAGQVVSCGPVASLGVAANTTFDVVVRLAPTYIGSGGDVINTATAASTTPDPSLANNTSLPVSPAVGSPSADLSTTKSALGASVTPGGTFTYRIVAANAGPSAATNVTIQDALPAQLAFVSSPSGCTATGQNVTCGPVAQLAPGGSSTFDVVVRLDGGYTGDGSDIGNVATVTSSTADPASGNDASLPAPPPPVGTPSADLALAKTAVDASATPGDAFTYRLVASNAGPSSAANVVVRDALPAGLTFVSSPESCTAVGQNVTCPAVATVATGASATFDLLVRLDPAYTGNGGDIANVATVTSATDDPVAANDTSPPAPPPPVGAPAADVRIVKSVSGASVLPGQTYGYTLQVTNAGPSVATGVVVVDALPAPVAFVGSTAGCTAAGQTITCPAVATLAVGASASFDIQVRLDPAYAGDGSDVVNSAVVTTVTLDPAPGNNTSSLGAPPVGPGQADVTVVKDVSPNPVAPGGTFVYTLLASNQGPSNASDVVVTDPLPAGVTLVSSAEGCTAAGQLVTCPTIATMAPGGSAAFTLLVRLDAGYAGNGSDLPNTASVGSTTPDPTPGNDTSPPVTPLIGGASADLSTTKSVVDATVTAGTTFTYRVAVSNAGPSTAAGIRVTDTLPAATTFVSSTPAGCTAAGQVVTCPPVATLAVGGTATVDLLVRLDPAYAGTGADVLNVATVTATTPDPDPANDATPPTAPPPVGAPSADLAITKTAVESSVTPGETFTYRMAVTNAGPSTATNVQVTDPLPAALTFVSSPQGCTAVGQTVSCGPFATLAPGATATVDVVVRLDAAYTGDGSDAGNVATVTSFTPDPQSANDASAPAPPPVGAASADLSTAKSTLEPAVIPGEPFTYRVVVTNAGPSVATAVTVTDPLPAAVAFVSSPSGCTAAAQTVTCGPVAALAPGASATFDLVVRLDPAYAGDGSDLGNVATTESVTADPNPANDGSPPAPPPPVGPASADLSTSKTALDAAVIPGGTITYRIVVTNAGPSVATAVRVTDTLPAPLAFVSSPSGCTAAGQTVTCGPLATLGVGTSATFDIVTRLDPAYTGNGSDLGNVATATSATADPNPANDGSSPAPPPPVGPASADLSTSKTALEPAVIPGGTITYRIVVTNGGPSVASDVGVTDTLPAALAFVSSPSGCTAAGQTVTCAPVATVGVGTSATFDIVARLDPAYTGNGSDLGNVAAATSATADPNPANDGSSPAPPPPVGPASADLSTAKSALEASVTPGGTFTYRIVVTNAGPSAATAVTVSDPLPAPLTFVSSPQGCTAAGQTVTCGPVPALGAGASTTFDVVVRLDAAYAGTGGDIGNVATASSPTADPNPGNDASPTAPPPVVNAPSADLSVTKTVVEASVTPGTTFTYRIVAANAGPSLAAAVTATDLLPAGVTFVSSPQGCTAVGQTVTCGPVASLAPGGSATFDVVARLDPSYTGDGSDVPNVATVAGATADPQPLNDTSLPATLAAGPASADLAVTKAALEGAVTPGQTFTYRIAVVNDGPSTAASVTVADALPAALQFVSSPSGCTASGQAVTCGPVAQLLPSAQRTFDVVVRLDPAYGGDGSDIQNVASASSTTADPNPGNDANPPAPPPAVGPAQADLATTKTAVGPATTPGETFTYRIQVTNLGPSTATAVAVSDPLPAPLAFVSSPTGCTATGQNVSCPPVATLAPGASATHEIVVRLDASYAGDGSDVQNVATATSATPDPNPGNDGSPPALPPPVGPAQADVQILKRVSPDAVTPGGTFSYTLQVANNGPSTALGVVASDVLPLETSFVSSAAGCTADGQTVTCPTIATLEVGAKAVFDIVVRLDPAYVGDGSDVVNRAVVTAATIDPLPANNASPLGAPPVGPGEADVAIVKDVSPAPVSPGGTFSYTLLASNQGPSDASSVVVSDPLPAGVTLVSSPQGCTAAGQLVTCPSIDTMAPGDFATFVLIVRLDPGYTGDGGDLPNSATVESDTTDPVPANGTSPPVIPTVGAASADLAVTKGVLESAVTPGTTFTYRITVENRGPSTASAVGVEDTLPAQVEFVSSPDGCMAVGQTVTCPPVATLAVGASAQVDLVVRLDPAYAGNGTDVVNIARASAITPDPDPSNDASPPAGPPPVGPPSADLAITKTAVGATVTPGTSFTYRIEVTNAGPSVATAVQITDPLPAPLTFVSSPDGCTAAGQVVSCPEIPALAVGASTTVALVVLLHPDYTGDGSDIANVASVTSFAPDPDPTNDLTPPALPPAVAPPSADLGITKRIDESEIEPGGTLTYRIETTNAGPSTATGVVVTDPLPAGIVFVASPSGCMATGQTVTCPALPSLAPGASRTETIVARLDATYAGDGSDLPNVATVTSGSADPEPSNDASPPVVPRVRQVEDSADLATTKVALGPSVTPGETITYRITVTNGGPAAAANVVISDPLPAPLTFVSSPQGCSAAGTLVTCPALPSMAAGTSTTVEIVARLDPAYTGNGSDLGNAATVTSATPDPDPSDNGSPVAPPPPVGPPQADLATAKTALGAAVSPGESFTYRIAVTNQGPSVARNVVVTDVLPARLAFVSSPQGCTAAGQTVSCPAAATLAVGATTTIDLAVRLDPAYRGDGGDVRNVARARSDTGDPNPDNDQSPTPGAAPPPVGSARSDVAISQRLAAGRVAPGSTVTLEVTVTQRGPATATDVVVTETLPEGLTFLGSSEACTAAAREVICPLATRTLAPSGVTTLTLDVRVDSPADEGAGTTSSAPAVEALQASPLIVVARVTAVEDDPAPDDNTFELALGVSADEVCDNCLDDDGDGLVDAEDDDCCQSGTLTFTRTRLMSRKDTLRAKGRVDGGAFAGVDPRQETIRLQVRDASGATVCCAIAGSDWKKVLGRVYWARGLEDVCGPVSSLCLIVPKRGPTRTVLNGGSPPLTPPLDVTLRAGTQCVRGTTGTGSRRAGKGSR